VNASGWQAAKSVLADVLARPADERPAFLAARCPDPALRQEVEAYLREYDESFLESAITVSDVLDRVARPRELLDLPPGTRIGPYVVLDRLGAGGMGQVFLGNDTRLHRKVALKCLTARASEEDLRSKLLFEARAAARISHPNIAAVYDVVEHGDRAFIVMEYVDGENLADTLRRERLPLARALAVSGQLASALAAAHATGIVHRDLKPGNIQVARDGSVKVLDFGVAQAVSLLTTAPPSEATTRLPFAAARPQAGTPAYMSPEQMFGRPVDHRSDIYSLGVILYELVAGRRPYAATDPLALVKALGQRIARPVDPAVPPALHDVIAQALAVNPDERYQTAAELGADLAVVAKTLEPAPEAATLRASAASRPGRVVRLAGAVLAVPIALTFLGFLMTAAFNLTLGRTAPFDDERWTVWFEMGLRSLVTPLLDMGLIVMGVWAVRLVLRLLSLSSRIERVLTTNRTRTRVLGVRLGLDDPVVASQTTAVAGALALAAVAWRFRHVIEAWASLVSESPPDTFEVLRAGSNLDAHLYRFALAFVILALSLTVAHIRRLRAARGEAGRGAGSMAVAIGTLVVAVLMSEVPYRIMWKNKFERISLDRERCYVIGQGPGELLVYCPDRDPPRNRIVASDAPGLERTGVIESIFSPPGTSN
jgi:predicted Ser/Thr protein kinase